MVELFAIYSICKKTVENAQARGKKKGMAIFYTIGIWFGMEIFGAALAGFWLGFFGITGVAEALIYIFAIGFAAIGGYIAILISRVAKPINPIKEEKPLFIIGKHKDDISNKWDVR